ncbi:MAG: hypothetical protein ACI9P5_003652 [Saprospiraceae bacterium]|jgi:hypothetical protein
MDELLILKRVMGFDMFPEAFYLASYCMGADIMPLFSADRIFTTLYFMPCLQS